MSKNIYEYTAGDLNSSKHAPEEIHHIFVNELVGCIMGSEFIISAEFGLGGLLMTLNINSVITKYSAPKNVVSALSKHFKTLHITSDSYRFELVKNLNDIDSSKNTYYKNLIALIMFSVKDLNNLEDEIRDAIMSVDNFIEHSSSIVEKYLPRRKYGNLLRFSVVEKNLRVGYEDNLHDFPIERTIEKNVSSRINFSFHRAENGDMIPFNPYELLIDDIFRKRYLRDSEWPYLLFSDLELTCQDIKTIFDVNKKNAKKYRKFFSEKLKFFS